MNDLLSKIIVKVNSHSTELSQLSADIDDIGTQEEIVQQVIAALGTPVFGTVDSDKKIVLKANLVDGDYPIGYEDENGDFVQIGVWEVGGEQIITENIPIQWEVGLKLGKTDNNHTTVSVVEGTANGNAYAASQHIAYDPNAEYKLSMSETSYRQVSVCCYDASGNNIGYFGNICGSTNNDAGVTEVVVTPVEGTKTIRLRMWFGFNGVSINDWLKVVSLTKTYVA